MAETIPQFIQTLIGFIQSNVTPSLGNWAIAGMVYLLVWVVFARLLNRWKIQLVRRAGFAQIRAELKAGILVALISSVFAASILSGVQYGWLQIYTDLNQYGIGYAIFSFFLFWIIDDAWFYWCHRLMHHPKVYKYVHALHHKSLDVNPFSSFSFHVIESLILTFWILPVTIFVPIHVGVLTILQFLGLFNNLKSHLGYELYPAWFQKTWLKYLVASTHHNLHHTRYNGNYGLHFRFWDIFCKTEFTDYEKVFSEVRHRRSSKVIDNTFYRNLVVSRIEKETDDTCSVYFEDVPKEFLQYKPGQYLSIRVKLQGQNHDRLFSLSSSPTEDKFLRLTMKLNGPVTHHFFYEAKPGQKVQALLPMGDFYLSPNSEQSKTYLMIAGGSGITPIFSMIKSLLHKEPHSQITLFYSNRSQKSKIFSRELDELSKKFKNLKVLDFYSEQKRLSSADIHDYASTHTDFECYICGPTQLKQAVKEYLIEDGVSVSQIHSEDFVDAYKPWPEFHHKSKLKLASA